MEGTKQILIQHNSRTLSIGHCILCKLGSQKDRIDKLFMSYRQRRCELAISMECFNEPSPLPSIALEHSENCAARAWNMHYEVPFQVRLAMSIVLSSREGHIFAVKHDTHIYQNPKCWGFPTVYMLPCETFEAAIARCIRDIMGIGLTYKGDKISYGTENCPFRPLLLYEAVFPPKITMGPPKQHDLVMIYHITVPDSDIRLIPAINSEYVDMGVWLDSEQLNAIYSNGEDDLIGIGSKAKERFAVNTLQLSGVAPNRFGEGLSEVAHKAIRYIQELEIIQL